MPDIPTKPKCLRKQHAALSDHNATATLLPSIFSPHPACTLAHEVHCPCSLQFSPKMSSSLARLSPLATHSCAVSTVSLQHITSFYKAPLQPLSLSLSPDSPSSFLYRRLFFSLFTCRFSAFTTRQHSHLLLLLFLTCSPLSLPLAHRLCRLPTPAPASC